VLIPFLRSRDCGSAGVCWQSTLRACSSQLHINSCFLPLIAYTVAIEKPEPEARKASHCGRKNNRDHAPRSLYYCLLAPHIYVVLFSAHIPFVVNRSFNVTPTERLQQYYATYWIFWKSWKGKKSCSFSVNFQQM